MFSDCVLRQSGRCCLQDGRPQRTDAAAELEAAPTPPPSFTLVGGRGYWQGGGARGVHLTALQVRQSRCSFAEQDMKFGIETHFLFFFTGQLFEQDRRDCCGWGRLGVKRAQSLSQRMKRLSPNHQRPLQSIVIFTKNKQGTAHFKARWTSACISSLLSFLHPNTSLPQDLVL